MPAKIVSTFNGANPTPTIYLVLSEYGIPTIRSIWGYCNGTDSTQYFLQLFNSNTLPDDATIPLWSLQVYGNLGFGPFNYADAGIDLSLSATGSSTNNAPDPSKGLILVLSTTEATLTVATGGVTMDVSVQLDTGLQNIPYKEVVGGNISNLQVVADPSTSKLVGVAVQNNEATTTVYLMLFGYANPATGAIPYNQTTLKVPPATLALPELLFQFGSGLAVNQQTSDYVNHTGIYLYGSTTPATYTAYTGNLLGIAADYI